MSIDYFSSFSLLELSVSFVQTLVAISSLNLVVDITDIPNGGIPLLHNFSGGIIRLLLIDDKAISLA